MSSDTDYDDEGRVLRLIASLLAWIMLSAVAGIAVGCFVSAIVGGIVFLVGATIAWFGAAGILFFFLIGGWI